MLNIAGMGINSTNTSTLNEIKKLGFRTIWEPNFIRHGELNNNSICRMQALSKATHTHNLHLAQIALNSDLNIKWPPT